MNTIASITNKNPFHQVQSLIERFVFLEESSRDPSGIAGILFPFGASELIFNVSVRSAGLLLPTGIVSEIAPMHAVVVGQRNHPLLVIDKISDVICVKMQPYGLYFLSGLGQSAIANTVEQIETISKRPVVELFKMLNATDSFEIRRYLIESYLNEWWATNNHKFDSSIVSLVEFVRSKRGLVTVEQISETFGVTRRTLLNRFKNQIGLAPKEFCEIVQLNHFLQLFAENSGFRHKSSLTEMALDAGYYDQAHLLRNFKRYTGNTPSAYRNMMNVAS